MNSVLILMICGSLGLFGEEPNSTTDPFKEETLSVIGLSLQELISTYGAPLKAYVVRGPESWQDDVVLSYPDFECYIYEEHVWQIKLTQAFEISVGDSKMVALLVFGASAHVFEDSILVSLPSRNWPLALRVNFDKKGSVDAIYVYRPDI